MESVSIVGVGQTAVGEHWEQGLRNLAAAAVLAAMQDADLERADALFVGNMLGFEVNGQSHLGALIADFCGMRGIPAVRVEAACASGAAALHAAVTSIAAGQYETVVVCGVEKMTGARRMDASTALVSALDWDYEAVNGLSFTSAMALIMQRYMHEYKVPREAFAGFVVNAHRNGARNPAAMYRSKITAEMFAQARVIADPISLMDSPPICDGAAALILRPSGLVSSSDRRHVRIAASTVATDALAVHDRPDPLFLQAAHLSAARAYAHAGIGPQDIDLFELHDGYSILAALSLEACGFCERGRGTALATEEGIGIRGTIPISTMGGLKARGHPAGATGVYQVADAIRQLRGDAGDNQVLGARIAMTQNIGGTGATAVTHILQAGA